MRWHEDLYAGASVLHKQKRIKWKIVHNVGTLYVYVIAFAANEKNLLDIIPARELMQKHYPKRDLYIIGLAGDYNEALELSGKIISEVYQMTGGFDVRGYIGQKRKQGI